MEELSSSRVSPDPPEEEEEEAPIAPHRSKRSKVCDQRCHPFPDLFSASKREQEAAADSNHNPPAVCSQEDRNDEYDKRSVTSAAAAIDHDDNDLLLKDASGNPRGAYISLKDEESGLGVLKMLYEVYGECKKHLGRVQKYTEHLYHYNFKSPGFPLQHGSDGSQFFTPFASSHNVSEMESFITQKIRDTLMDIGYCAPNQELQLYLSFLKTQEKTSVQPPHIDHQWENVVPPDPDKRGQPRSYRGDYNEWVPFIALFPLTEAGMTVEVWQARNKHDKPERPEHATGRLVTIPYGQILLLRADVVHAGGFLTTTTGADDHPGQPRGHFYVYKTPKGAGHPYPLSNCYKVEVDGQMVPLLDFYQHHPDCADTNNVVF